MRHPDEHNPFDALGFNTDPDEIKRQRQQAELDGEHLDNLIHRTFCQNEAGAELLKKWRDSLVKIPTANAGDDLLAIGINEGVKSFIRNIIITIDKVNNG